ncbi:MAG: hypothetical protein LBI84_10345 [Propionibacteriaceae bacterium]|nr:hypothetical protein [Propionibacteriaceae bacterium]
MELWPLGLRLAGALTCPSQPDGDRGLALETYEWNLRLTHAVLRDTAHFEIALRNAYDLAVQTRWNRPSHWLSDPASPVLALLWRNSHGRRLDVNIPNRREVTEAVHRTRGGAATPGAVIAELPFGFWWHLSDAAHEQTVWIPYIYYSWPKGTSRRQIDRAVYSVNALRNRAAHSEPLFSLAGWGSVIKVCSRIVSLLDLLNTDLADYVRQTSTVQAVMAQRP